MPAARKWRDMGGEVRKSETIRDHEQEVRLHLWAMRPHRGILSRVLPAWELCDTKIISGPEMEGDLDGVKAGVRDVLRREATRVQESQGQALHRWHDK